MARHYSRIFQKGNHLFVSGHVKEGDKNGQEIIWKNVIGIIVV
jgi:hypothetical protein